VNKTFRLNEKGLKILKAWSGKLNISETDVVRIALRLLPGNFWSLLNLLILVPVLNP